MSIISDKVKCGKCGEELSERTNVSLENRIPCPQCGSFSRSFFVTINETLHLRDKLEMKGKKGGKGKPFIKTISGDDLYRKTGEWNFIARTIDYENNLYSETITDPDTGTIIHQCIEPLSEHRNHGSAKKK
jgi:hypothetical protein